METPAEPVIMIDDLVKNLIDDTRRLVKVVITYTLAKIDAFQQISYYVVDHCPKKAQ